MLEQILTTKKQELQTLQLPEKVTASSASFYKALQQSHRSLGLIAEVKQASPSKGMLKEDFEPAKIAKAYEEGGADAVSVLTDQTYFRGNRAFIGQIKQNVRIPVLRKDFIIEPLQVEESWRIGADAILLIVAALNIDKLYELYCRARDMGMDCLVEVHSEEELNRLLAVFTPDIIGVNNRDLSNFNTSLLVSEKLSEHMPKETLFVSESGITTYEDIQKVKSFDADAVLVGEALMRARTPKEGIQRLFGSEADGTTST